MADNKNLKGQQDRNRVAGNEDYEVQYIADEMGVTAEVVRQAIEQVGNSRKDIEEYINKSKA